MATTPSAVAGANIRAEMARRGISQTTLAAAVGMSQFSISSRIRGVTAWTLDELVAVADALDVPLEVILPSKVAS